MEALPGTIPGATFPAVYTPAAFREDEPQVLHRIIRQHSFATLVTVTGGVPVASHLPFVLDAGKGELGTLRGHLARANPQVEALSGGEDVLVVFTGPHGYVSPSWYDDRPRVPTWNYVAVHVHGTSRQTTPAELRLLLGAMVEQHESRFAEPWRMESLPASYVDDMLGHIVGFEIAIRRIEGKLKLGQNRGVEEQRLVADALRRGGDPGDVALAEWMDRGGRPSEK